MTISEKAAYLKGYMDGLDMDKDSAEGKMIEEYLSSLSRFKLCVTKIKIVNSPTSPYFFLIETK